MKDHWDEAYDLGFAAGLKAARAAVQSLSAERDTSWHMREQVLSVLDGLARSYD